MDVRERLCACGLGDQNAWRWLWPIAECAGRDAAGRALRIAGFGQDLVEDVLQDFYLYLRCTDMRCLLLVFGGDSEPQLRAFLRCVMRRFAIRLAKRWRRGRSRESAAISQMPPPERGGPTATLIEEALCRLAARIPQEDRRRLQLVASASPMVADTEFAKGAPAGAHSARSIRRWRQDLFVKYGEALLDSRGLV